MTPTTTVTLGDFTFSSTEVPESMPFGGEQALTVHRLVGGQRVINAMGADPSAIEWSGLFFGQNALARARYLDWLCIQGKPLVLAWSELRYTVMIRKFAPVFELQNRIPYRINCEVVSLDSQPVKVAASAGVDQWVAQDMASASKLATDIGDGPLSDSVGALGSAIKSVSTFANAAQSTINSVLLPIQAVTSRLAILQAAASNTINSVATVGGILPNTPIAKQAASLTNQAAAMAQSPRLLQLNAVTSRISSNVSGAATSSASTPTAGANLFRLAADAYGDATEWATIARANGLSDPQVSGIKTLNIPATPTGSGGVPNA